jgi:hypothetical protein
MARRYQPQYAVDHGRAVEQQVREHDPNQHQLEEPAETPGGDGQQPLPVGDHFRHARGSLRRHLIGIERGTAESDAVISDQHPHEASDAALRIAQQRQQLLLRNWDQHITQARDQRHQCEQHGCCHQPTTA